jgi:voltage-gated potassium channel
MPAADRVEAWERRAEVPLLLLAAAFLVAYAWPVLDKSIDPGIRSSLRLVSWTVWGAFAIDLAIRLWLAKGLRLRYAVSHWYDVAMVLLPLLRPLRLLRMLTILRMFDRTGARASAGRVGIYVGGASTMLVFLAALATLDAESRNPDASITTYGDALWWAAVTTTTVGYGELYPVTTEGRFVAVGLMLVGIGLIGSVTAMVVTVLTSHVENAQEHGDGDVTAGR